MLIERSVIIKRMRELGFLYRDIGDVFEVSRQRAHQLATGYRSPCSAESKRRYRLSHKAPGRPRSHMTPEQVKVKRREYYLKNRERILEQARQLYAMKKQEAVR